MSQRVSNLTAVVCTLNSQSSLDRCLESLENIVNQLIVVDGGSSDNSVAIARKHNALVLEDSGSGLGEARGIGLSSVKTEYVLNCGADNVLSLEVVQKMLEILESQPKTYGVSCQTVVEEKNYLSRVNNRVWRTKFSSGRSKMVGTPNIFRTDQLRKFGYNKSRGWSDDEEVCTRMSQEVGALFEIIESECLEIGQATLSRQIYRYFHYGFSDYEIFSDRQKEWNLKRKIKSVRHPFMVELYKPLKQLEPKDKIFCMPLLITATVLRYSGWMYRLVFSQLKN